MKFIREMMTSCDASTKIEVDPGLRTSKSILQPTVLPTWPQGALAAYAEAAAPCVSSVSLKQDGMIGLTVIFWMRAVNVAKMGRNDSYSAGVKKSCRHSHERSLKVSH